MPDEVPQAF